jgi:hypothetical protein
MRALHSKVLLVGLAVACWRPTEAPRFGDVPPIGATPSTVSPSNEGIIDSSNAEVARVRTYTLAGHTLQVTPDAGSCIVAFQRSPDDSPIPIRFELDPPCYLVEWTRPPAPNDAQGVSDGSPIGTTGGLRAYRYDHGIVAVVVIGDRVGPEDSQSTAGLRCGSGAQALLIDETRAWPSTTAFRGPARPHCVEWGGPEEKEYWILAHEDE